MTQSIIDIGDAPNDGTGDPVRDAFNKCNNNFTELYAADALGGGTATPVPPQGRLTLQTGVPVMTTTQAAKTTILYSPYCGNQVPIYSGTSMVMTTFAELSVATTDTTKSPAAIGASKVNDWFVWSDAGTVRIGHGPDWTNDTTRSAGTALVMVQGLLLNAVALTNGPAVQRGTYVGTTRSNASSQLDWIFGGDAVGGLAGFFGVWNCYNRVNINTIVRDTTANWTAGALAGYRAANNSVGNRVSFVLGLTEDGASAYYGLMMTSGNGSISIGVDSTAVPVGSLSYSATSYPMFSGWSDRLASPGFHFISAIEYPIASTTWQGQQSTGGVIYMQPGLSVQLRM